VFSDRSSSGCPWCDRDAGAVIWPIALVGPRRVSSNARYSRTRLPSHRAPNVQGDGGRLLPATAGDLR
jgi:hypothetical protein